MCFSSPPLLAACFPFLCASLYVGTKGDGCCEDFLSLPLETLWKDFTLVGKKKEIHYWISPRDGLHPRRYPVSPAEMKHPTVDASPPPTPIYNWPDGYRGGWVTPNQGEFSKNPSVSHESPAFFSFSLLLVLLVTPYRSLNAGGVHNPG